jgi:hypothetical protein
MDDAGLGLLVSWFFFSGVVGVLAHRKGRSGISFFGLSLLLSPVVGFVAVLLAKPDTEKAAARGAGRKCPHCAEIVKADAKVCRFCGRDLPPLSEPTPAGPRFKSRKDYESFKAKSVGSNPPDTT